MKKIEKMRVVIVAGIFLLLAGITYSMAGSDNQVDYPEDYRKWRHAKSMVIQQNHPLYESFGGIHHIYANEKALKAMKKGKSFPDGSVLVFDLLEAKSENNAIVEGPRKILGVMEKDSGEFSGTGGWGFEGFKGDSRERIVADPEKECFNCHESQKNNDYVFGKYRQ